MYHVTSPAGHVLEEAHDAEDGVEFLTSTRKDWGDSLFAGHITWHLTLYYLGEFQMGGTFMSVTQRPACLVSRSTLSHPHTLTLTSSYPHTQPSHPHTRILIPSLSHILTPSHILTDLGDTDSVLREYDTVLAERAVPENNLGILDATSLLWRLDLMGIDTGGRWQHVTDSCSSLIGHSALAWSVEEYGAMIVTF